MKHTKYKIVLTRITEDQEQKLTAYCQKTKQSKSKVLRNLIDKI
jgi:hypothetical protein